MSLTLASSNIKNWIRQKYHALQQIPFIGFFARFSWDTMNLSRNSRRTLNEVREFSQSLPYQLTQIQHQLTEINEKLNIKSKPSLNQSMDTILELLSKTVYYQPLHGYVHLNNMQPQRPCTDRADVIHQALSTMGPTRLLDVGCSFGYFSYFLAMRGYIVDAIDFDQNCIEICNFLVQFNPENIPYFANAAFDIDYIKQIPQEKYDVALLLSVLHHVTSEQGVPYVQDMMQSLLDRVPVLIVELALREEDVPFPWKDRLPFNDLDIFAKCENISIIKLGCFSTHLSTIKRPLYMVCKNTVTINERSYEILKRRFIAHEDAHHYFRVFYEAKDAFIKNYRLQHNQISLNESKAEMLNEISVYKELPANNLFPSLIDYTCDDVSIKLVLSKLPGATLKHHLETDSSQLNATSIIKQLLQAVSR